MEYNGTHQLTFNHTCLGTGSDDRPPAAKKKLETETPDVKAKEEVACKVKSEVDCQRIEGTALTAYIFF